MHLRPRPRVVRGRPQRQRAPPEPPRSPPAQAQQPLPGLHPQLLAEARRLPPAPRPRWHPVRR
eukprot:3409861-Lingulodinium_polyedra.AAC.1